MTDPVRQILPVSELRIGLYIHLDLGWMDHPFPLSSFKITSEEQIEIIRRLGLQSVAYSPERSDPPPETTTGFIEATTNVPPSEANHDLPVIDARAATLAAQQQAQLHCEKQYLESARAIKGVFDQVNHAPEIAADACKRLTRDMVTQLEGHAESALRLLAEGHGDRNTLHALNVTVLSLLLGKAMGLSVEAMESLGQAALLHDVGKLELPDRVRNRDEHFTAAHFKLYQEHVAQGVTKARQLGLDSMTLLTISQHHEMADGSGFPVGLKAEKITPTAHILGLTNRYDGLCNPPNPLKSLTPHEALSLMFATMKERFERQTLNAFIRMMGVYPPGSVVQLKDERYALVVSVNASRPLKPRVLVYDRLIASQDAILLDLQDAPSLGIQRSLRPDQLPRQALAYLSPRQRICYYFERAVCAVGTSESVT
jgi:putative nucleotidyltransferase with HDIG domain